MLAESDEYADIKALMSKRDILVDVSDAAVRADASWDALKLCRPKVPLLLLYPIEAESKPSDKRASRGGEPKRMALNAVGDLMGMGIVFPGSPDRSGNYFSVELDVPTPEQLEEEESADNVND